MATRELVFQCLDSLAKQSLGSLLNSGVEVIFVSHCEPRRRRREIARYSRKIFEPGVFRLVKLEDENLLPNGVRRYGVLSSIGDFVFFLDSDDELDSVCLEKMTKQLAESNGEDDLIFGAVARMSHGGTRTQELKARQLNINSEPVSNHPELVRSGFVNNILIRKKLTTHMFKIPEVQHEDISQTAHLLKIAGKVSAISSTTYFYRQTIGSITQVEPSIKHVEGIALAVSSLLDLLIQRGDSWEFEIEKIIKIHIRYMLARCQHHLELSMRLVNLLVRSCECHKSNLGPRLFADFTNMSEAHSLEELHDWLMINWGMDATQKQRMLDEVSQSIQKPN